jgi:tetratricopeptide (TPR) repeat protein
MADVATACAENNQPKESATLWRELLRWHPRSTFKDRVLDAWVAEAENNGERDKTLRLIERMRVECGDSPLLPRALISKARLEESAGDWSAAKQTLESLLTERRTPGEWKAEALLRLGEYEMRRGSPGTAIPHFQRIYVLYGRWKPQLARAYLRSAEAFEQLQDPEAAKRTYRELLQNDLPREFPEIARAQEKLLLLETLP